jgi:hypothetical protein
MELKDIRSGDVILYSGRSFVSKAIQFFERSRWSHASLVFDIYGELLTSEADAEGLIANDIKTSIKGCDIIVLRPKFEVNNFELSKFIAPCLGKHRYDFFRLIFVQIIWQLFHVWILNEESSEPLKRTICGEWVTYVLYKLFRYDSFSNWYEATPVTLFESELFEHINITS